MKTLIFTSLSMILAAGFALGAKVAANDPSIIYSPDWTSTTDANASGGAYQSSGTGTVTFNFTGTSLTLWRELDPSGDTATVTIDGNAWGTISFYFFQRTYQVPAVIDQLQPVNHQIMLTISANAPPKLDRNQRLHRRL
jgi:hypothetical protein